MGERREKERKTEMHFQSENKRGREMDGQTGRVKVRERKIQN